jgi:cytochrome c2
VDRSWTWAERCALLAFLRTGAAAKAEKVYLEPGNPRRGAEAFQAKGCARCHAIRGKGGRVGPDPGRRRAALLRSVASVAGQLWNHGLPMWAELGRAGLSQPEFSGQEMADVIAYLYFVNYLDAPGEPERGREIFSRKQCQSCHGVPGRGGNIGPDLARTSQLSDPIALVAAMWNHAPQMEEALRRVQLAWPRLERGEAADLGSYLTGARGPDTVARPR